MSLIDTTYFVRDLNVPLSSNNALNSNFTNSILRYENEILKSLLGYTLWKEFTDAVAAAEEENAPALAEKWVNLRDGAEFTFTVDGYTVNTKWNGLVNTDKISLIAYYVYYMHRKNHDSEYTGSGETKGKNENSVMVSPLRKLVWAQNSMVNLYGAIPLVSRKYNSFMDSGTYIHYDAEPSAYNFLLANRDTYPTWVFKPIGKVNSFGI